MQQGWYLEMIKCRRLNNTAQQQQDGGYFLISVIIIITFLSAVGFSLAGLVATQFQHTAREMYDQNAQLVAEAGIEESVTQLNSDSTFTGYASPQTFFNNSTQGLGTYATTVSENADGKSKTIISIGKVYRANNTSTPFLTRKVRAIVVGTTSGGYSVSTGPGGLILSGSASITNSNVYVDGTITLSGAASIGTQANPITVDAANVACPKGSNPGATYPTLCTGGSQPISMAFSTKIWGTVCATGQTSTGPNNNIQGGSGGAGLQVGCTAPTASQPYYNRSGIISGMTSSASGTSGTYACSGVKSISIPANTELTGGSLSWGNSCKITINGNVYIPGNLSIGGAAAIKVADTVGSTRPIIVVDGTVTVGGSASLAANSSGTGMDFVSFKNSTGDASQTPTGTNLYNSQQMQNVQIGGAASSAGMIFDAYWSQAVLSGSGHVGAVAGQVVNLSGAGTVIFGTTLSSGSQTWSITSYQQIH
jgi:hypothetical protein